MTGSTQLAPPCLQLRNSNNRRRWRHVLSPWPAGVLGDLQTARVKDRLVARCDEEVRTVIAIFFYVPLLPVAFSQPAFPVHIVYLPFLW